MAEIGRWNSLEVVKELDFGVYLNGMVHGEILMPIRYVPEGTKPGDMVDVFIYLDSEDRLIATTEQPIAQVGDFALLECVSVNSIGAFLDWGLMKDLFVPFREQRQKMEVGYAYVVYIYVDEQTNRIVGSAKVEDYLDLAPHNFTEGQEVDLVIYNQTDIGFKAIINNTHTGVIYTKDVFREVERGEKTKGYIKKIRADNKIDLIIDKPGYEKVDEVSKKILEKLKEQQGFIPLVDKSPAGEVYDMFGISKKTFKKAIGGLYKSKLITIEENGIKLV
ncbi:MAG TPA: S1-like domain-containing RNA-binding protein [Bacteroidia bacterium]|nr:S1-like domain-containing RNA-binding protein [Bacteroidia bacterium]